MKMNGTVALLAGICILSVLLIYIPLAGLTSILFPGLTILASALVIFRRRLSVGGVIAAVVLPLIALPLTVYILVSVVGMLLMGVIPLWLNGILSYVLQYAAALGVFALVCRILNRKGIRGMRGIPVLILAGLTVASAVLDELSYGLAAALPGDSVMDMMMFLSRRNPVLGFLSQAAFYGALFFMGYIVWRSVSREDSGTQEIQ